MSAPGWYPDSSRPGLARRRDGAQWTEHRAAMPQPTFVRETDGYAVASVISGVVGVPVVPIVLGVMARNRIRDSAGMKDGDGLASAGIILGALQLLLWIVVFAVVFGVAIWGGS